MQREVVEKMLNEYKSIKIVNVSTAIKYRYSYNNVNVNIYFDAFDENVPVLSMILNFEKEYYFTTLNTANSGINVGYLDNIPHEILKRISKNEDGLFEFSVNMEEHILNDSPKYINYNDDTFFTNTIKYSHKKDNLPFLWCLRKVHMTDKTLRVLSETMSIDNDILKAIQAAGFTIVRTDDASKRVSLTAIIDKYKIIIK